MRSEWKHYWVGTKESSRSVLLALGVSLVFWIFQLPYMSEENYLLNLGISGMYGLTIFSYIWILYAVAHAGVTYMGVKTGRSIRLGWGVHLPLSFFGMALGLITAKWFKALILNQVFSTSGILESLMLGSFITMMFMFYYAYKQSAEENLKLKAAKAETELHALKNQMQPHFLFNSLNSLTELIETNKDSAADMAMKLSDLYREILEISKKQLVSLDTEVSIITKYLSLEKLRFGDRLCFTIDVPENSVQVHLPPLVVQTLVENAVKHGIAPAIKGGTISVSVQPHESSGYTLSVTNTGMTTSPRSAGNGTGLTNTKAQLDLLYGNRHGFSLKLLGRTVEVSFWFSGESFSA